MSSAVGDGITVLNGVVGPVPPDAPAPPLTPLDPDTPSGPMMPRATGARVAAVTIGVDVVVGVVDGIGDAVPVAIGVSTGAATAGDGVGVIGVDAPVELAACVPQADSVSTASKVRERTIALPTLGERGRVDPRYHA